MAKTTHKKTSRTRKSRTESHRAASAGRSRASETIDKELAASALRKRQAGKEPTARELAALKRWQTKREEEALRDNLQNFPQKLFLELCGRQARTINEQAALYGLPIAGKTINLFDALRAYHDLFAKHQDVFRDRKSQHGQMAELVRRDKEAKVRLVEMRADEEAGKLVRASDVDRDRMKFVRYVRSILERLGSDLAVRLMPLGVSPTKVKRETERHCNQIRDEWVKYAGSLIYSANGSQVIDNKS